MQQAPVLDDPYSRTGHIYPTLSDDMMARLTAYGAIGHFDAGATLFTRGDRDVDFFVVVEGEVAILRTDQNGNEETLTVHGAGQFTGELDQVSGRALLVGARTLRPSQILRIPHGRVAAALAAETDIGETVMRAFILRRMGFLHHGQAGIIIVGPGDDADVVRIERFASRNGYPFQLLDPALDEKVTDFTSGLSLDPEDLPVVILPDRTILHSPGEAELADRLGLTQSFDPEETWDVAVVGAGPAGLAAATYAASEGLKTLVIEGVAPGGQAGTSSKIENYLGFPTGISGQALAGRAQVQAQKFGARIAVSRMAAALDCSTDPFVVTMEDGQSTRARVIVVATGARYRKLDLPDYDRFEGHGIHYAATAIEASLCPGQQVVVVGGGNSAGQAAMFLSRHAAHVHMLVRGVGLAATMSDYLVQRIDASPRITLHPHSAVSKLEGERRLERVSWQDVRTHAITQVASGNLFVMIGAVPNTDWLDGCLTLDEKGFVQTGSGTITGPGASQFATETPGIYAVGDVRAGSVKRVASGVGEGSVVVQAIHGWLEDAAQQRATRDARLMQMENPQ